MNAQAEMYRVFSLGRFTLYYANRRVFSYPGFHLWTGKRNIRIIPFPKKGFL